MPDEPFTPDSVEATPGAPEPVESWAPPREEWEQIRTFVGGAAPVLGQLAQALEARRTAEPQYQQPSYQQPQAAPAEFDPWEPESVRSYIAQEIQRGVEESMQYGLAPYAPLLETVASVEGEKQARAVLSDIGEQVGDFDQDAAMILAAGLLSQGNVMPDHALRTSAQYLHELEARIREDERTRYIEELKNLQNAPAEHPASGTPLAAEMETVPTGPRRYHEALENALRRRNAGLPIG